MEKEKIARINELSKKSKTTGLTETEKLEQEKLRSEYRAMFRESFTNTLENTYIKYENGKIEKLIPPKIKDKDGECIQ